MQRILFFLFLFLFNSPLLTYSQENIFKGVAGGITLSPRLNTQHSISTDVFTQLYFPLPFLLKKYDNMFFFLQNILKKNYLKHNDLWEIGVLSGLGRNINLGVNLINITAAAGYNFNNNKNGIINHPPYNIDVKETKNLQHTFQFNYLIYIPSVNELYVGMGMRYDDLYFPVDKNIQSIHIVLTIMEKK